MVVVIYIAGQNDFPCPDGWTVDMAENRIRSRYGFLNGGIDRNGEAMASTDTITPGSHYEFVNFQSQQGKVSEQQKVEGPKLKDGIPELQQFLTFSPPSVPSEKEHASCSRVVMDLPVVLTVSEDVLNASNSIWKDVHTRETDGRKFLYYASESDIVFYVRQFLRDISSALKLNLTFNAEVAIKQIRPDLCVLLMGMYLVGVVEVKKPGNNVLLEPTVLGELLDQMFLVEGFYGMGPAIGILTTAEEWIVSWFPVDTDTLAHQLEESPADSFSTPVKSTESRFEP
jgi:hypothetical protein